MASNFLTICTLVADSNGASTCFCWLLKGIFSLRFQRAFYSQSRMKLQLLYCTPWWMALILNHWNRSYWIKFDPIGMAIWSLFDSIVVAFKWLLLTLFVLWSIVMNYFCRFYITFWCTSENDFRNLTLKTPIATNGFKRKIKENKENLKIISLP